MSKFVMQLEVNKHQNFKLIKNKQNVFNRKIKNTN